MYCAKLCSFYKANRRNRENKDNTNCIYFYRYFFGRNDFCFEIHCETAKELDDFLTELRVAYPHIADFEVMACV
jgi:hypothetical protein